MATDIRIFISHVHEDDLGLIKLKGLLKDNGVVAQDYSVSSNNPNNARNEHYIKTQILGPRIRQSDVLIVYLSRNTKDSKWVIWEIKYAEKWGKRIVGIWARGEKDCDLPDGLERDDILLVGWIGPRIAGAVNGELDTSTSANPSTSLRPSVWSIVGSAFDLLRKAFPRSWLRR